MPTPAGWSAGTSTGPSPGRRRRRIAARRNAARTRRFARRHLRLGWRQWLDLEALAWRVRLPGYRPCRADLAFLAGIYGE
ncbi:hypothetical protein ACFQY5_28025 [Paeniroseomonas aquatica]|uniref:hypothetical protein n=1 Tax=Paeniroseomonas aquatica TaxID=373043 RepID=UPI003611E177